MTAPRDEVATARRARELALARIEQRRAELARGRGWLAVGDPARLEDSDLRAAAEVARLILAEITELWAAVAALDAELDSLDGERPPGVRLFLEWSSWLEGVADADQVLAELVPDPRRLLLGSFVRMQPSTAEAIVATVAANGGHVGDGQAFIDAAALDDDDVWDLDATARARLDPLDSRQSVATLLPLRLETRFRRPPPPELGKPFEPWRLRVRVEPDPLALATPPLAVSAAEAAAVAACWARCGGSLDGDQGAAAFAALADQVGGPRAAYLLRTVAVVPDGDGGFLPSDVYPERIDGRVPPLVGLPERLQLWGDVGGGLDRLDRLTPDWAAIAAGAVPDALRPGPDGSIPATWWTSFEAASRVGLATEIELDTYSLDEPSFSVLLVTGLGEEAPGGLLAAHADRGDLATVAPLRPTNTVAGQPAADLGRDPASWLAVARSPWGAAGDLLHALAGPAEHGGTLPAPDRRHHETAELLVTALWPVLWQRGLKDVADLGAEVWTLGGWAGRLLAAFGPYPTVRVGDLPYGVLPVADLARWTWRDGEPTVERPMAGALHALVGWFAQAAADHGTALGADAGGLLEVMARVPTSRALGTRVVLPVSLLAALHSAFPTGVSAQSLVDAWRDGTARLRELLPGPPTRLYLPAGYVEPLPQRVGPEPAPYLRRYLGSNWEELANLGDTHPIWEVEGLPPPPLARLVRHALLLTQAEVSRLDGEWWPTWRPPYVLPLADAEQLANDASRGGRVVELPRYAVDRISGPGFDPRAVPIGRQFTQVREAVERLAELPAERIAPVLPAVADLAGHRVDAWATAMATRRLRRLLAKGARRRLGAYGWVDDLRPAADPTPPTAAGLLHAPGYAQALAAAVLRDHAVHEPADPRWRLTIESRSARLAAALAEDVRAGAHLAEAIGREIERRAAEPARVLELRVAFPARPEWAGRRVCDGLAVLAAALALPWAPPAPLPAWLDPANLADLAGVLDTYGDLLVADAVHDVVDGRPASAQAAMEAAAGLGIPPELRLLRTRREGSTVRTTVLAALPWQDPDPDEPSPAALADPAVAATLEAECGQAPAWTWTAGGGSVSLAGLGLAVADVLLVPTARLTAAATAALGAPPDGGTAPGLLRRAAALCQLLGAQAGTPSSASAPDQVAEPGAAHLRERLAAVRAAAAALRSALETDPGAPLGADPSAAAAARRWGLTVADDAGADDAAELAARLTAAGAPEQDAKLPAPALAERIRALLRPVLGLPLVCPATAAGLRATPAGGDGRPALDADWLEVVAAVRPAMARLEAYQLGMAAPPWAAAASHPDPWSVDPPSSASAGTVRAVAYGPPAAVAAAVTGGRVGLGLLDAWGETVPARQHTSWAAFGFDAPRARAPQAVLLAVPSDEQNPLEEADLPGIVLQARALAHARAAGPLLAGGLAAGLPSPLLLATTHAGADLAWEGP